MFPRITLTIEPVGGAAADLLAGLQATMRALADELRESRKRKRSEEPPRGGAAVPPGAAGDVPPGAGGALPGAAGPGDVPPHVAPPGAAGEVLPVEEPAIEVLPAGVAHVPPAAAGLAA